jgi:hypothetical protein
MRWDVALDGVVCCPCPEAAAKDDKQEKRDGKY